MKSVLYYLLFGFTWLVSLVPYWILYRISDLLYFVIYYIAGYRTKTVFKNLKTSFPEKTDEEITTLAKAFYRHFSDFLVEIVKCISISKRNLKKRMKLVNPEIFLELAASNRSIALVTGHYNNWEMLSILPETMPHRCMIIYRPLNNKVMNRISLYMRSRFGTVMVPMENVYREALSCRAANRLFSVWFLADQRPPRNSKFWTSFLNHETAFFEGVEKISKKLDLAVVFMDIQKIKRGHYEARLEKLFESTAETKENEVLVNCIRKIEDEILRKPEYWLWSHKRFKHSRPENIKLINA
jgi:KDO2-lipid IV(A) lauroyltransferase